MQTQTHGNVSIWKGRAIKKKNRKQIDDEKNQVKMRSQTPIHIYAYHHAGAPQSVIFPIFKNIYNESMIHSFFSKFAMQWKTKRKEKKSYNFINTLPVHFSLSLFFSPSPSLSFSRIWHIENAFVRFILLGAHRWHIWWQRCKVSNDSWFQL